MAKVDITLQDNGTVVDVTVTYDPPVEIKSTATTAQRLVNVALGALREDYESCVVDIEKDHTGKVKIVKTRVKEA